MSSRQAWQEKQEKLEDPCDRVVRRRREMVHTELQEIANRFRQEAINELLDEWSKGSAGAEHADQQTRQAVVAYLEEQVGQDIQYRWNFAPQR